MMMCVLVQQDFFYYRTELRQSITRFIDKGHRDVIMNENDPNS